MSSDRATARADAKAEKARAKAMRPWWKRKRVLIPAAFVLLIVVIAAVGGGAEDDTETASSSDTTVAEEAGGVSGEAGEADDVTITSCDLSDFGTVDVGLEIVNNSSKRSNYLISVTVEDDGGTRVGEAHAAVNNVEPGQTARDQAVGSVSGEPESVSCRLANVDRLASS